MPQCFHPALFIHCDHCPSLLLDVYRIEKATLSVCVLCVKKKDCYLNACTNDLKQRLTQLLHAGKDGSFNKLRKLDMATEEKNCLIGISQKNSCKLRRCPQHSIINWVLQHTTNNNTFNHQGESQLNSRFRCSILMETDSHCSQLIHPSPR